MTPPPHRIYMLFFKIYLQEMHEGQSEVETRNGKCIRDLPVGMNLAIYDLCLQKFVALGMKSKEQKHSKVQRK